MRIDDSPASSYLELTIHPLNHFVHEQFQTCATNGGKPWKVFSAILSSLVFAVAAASIRSPIRLFRKTILGAIGQAHCQTFTERGHEKAKPAGNRVPGGLHRLILSACPI